MVFHSFSDNLSDFFCSKIGVFRGKTSAFNLLSRFFFAQTDFCFGHKSFFIGHSRTDICTTCFIGNSINGQRRICFSIFINGFTFKVFCGTFELPVDSDDLAIDFSFEDEFFPILGLNDNDYVIIM